MLAIDPQIPRPSVLIIGTITLILMASVAMFTILVRRSTTRRQWVSLKEWARRRRLRVQALDAAKGLPVPLNELAKLRPQLRLHLANTNVAIVQFAIDSSTDDQPNVGVWNVLIRRLKTGQSFAPSGLRPVSVAESESAIDLFALTTFHSLSNDRFSVQAVDARSANRLADSSARALLPEDVGLLMFGDALLLDFSARPFDPVELDRMLSVSEQIAASCC